MGRSNESKGDGDIVDQWIKSAADQMSQEVWPVLKDIQLTDADRERTRQLLEPRSQALHRLHPSTVKKYGNMMTPGEKLEGAIFGAYSVSRVELKSRTIVDLQILQAEETLRTRERRESIQGTIDNPIEGSPDDY